MIESITADGRTFSNINIADIGLLELLDGSTDAPKHIIARLCARGYIEADRHGSPKLTARGRRRAKAIVPYKKQLLAEFSPAPAMSGNSRQFAFQTVASCAFRT